MQVNNKYTSDRFDPGKESHYLYYLGANNLYGWVMSGNLPAGGFKWIKNPEKLKDNISKLAKEAGKGYLLDVDVSYPDNMHDLHNDILFMCKKKKINGLQRLVLNLYDKKKYVIHITDLTQVLKQGLVLDKVHQMIEFNQSAWLAPCIKFNTQLRTRTISERIFSNS